MLEMLGIELGPVRLKCLLALKTLKAGICSVNQWPAKTRAASPWPEVRDDAKVGEIAPNGWSCA